MASRPNGFPSITKSSKVLLLSKAAASSPHDAAPSLQFEISSSVKLLVRLIMSTSAAAPLVAPPLTFGGDDDDDDPSSPPIPFHARDRARIVALSATEGHKTFKSWGRM